MRKEAKLRELEAFRGIAAVAVVLFHSQFHSVLTQNPLIRKSYLFVDFFFILSGFVIAYVYADKLEKTSDYARYLLLRFGRLYPLHLSLLLAWLVYIVAKYVVHVNTGLGQDPSGVNNAESFVYNLLMIHSLGVLDYLSWNAPSWSISVEAATYLVFAVFCALFSNRKLRPALALAISISSYALIPYLSDRHDLQITYDYGILRCTGGFFAGVCVCYLYQRFDGTLRKGNSVIEITVIGLLVLMMLQPVKSIYFQLLIVGVMILVVMVFSLQNQGVVSKVLRLWPFQIAGKFSYSIYMTHAILIDVISNIFEYLTSVKVKQSAESKLIFLGEFWGVIANVALVVFVVAVSSLSYRFIEDRYRHRFKLLASKIDQKALSEARG